MVLQCCRRIGHLSPLAFLPPDSSNCMTRHSLFVAHGVALLVTFAFASLSSRSVSAFEVNYDESEVPDYELPDPLVSEAGTPITTAEQWNKVRRPELLEQFRRHVYG